MSPVAYFHFLADAEASYKQKTKAIRELNSMNNQYMLAISQCQVDLIDLRQTVRQLTARFTKLSMKASVQKEATEEVKKQAVAQTFNVPDSDDDEDEIAELSEEISILEKQITKLKTTTTVSQALDSYIYKKKSFFYTILSCN